MKRTNLIYLTMVLLTYLFAVTSCKDKSSDAVPEEKPAPENPQFLEGQVVSSVIYENDVVKEEMIDTIVNFGSKEIPALFYVNQVHKIDDAPIEDGNVHSNVFRHLHRSDLLDFIEKWGQVNGMTIDQHDTSAAGIAQMRLAFFLLHGYVLTNDIDLPLLIALSKSPKELGFAKKWVDAATDLAKAGVKLDDADSPDGIFRSLEISGKKISEFSGEVKSAGMTEKDYLQKLHQRGAGFANSFITARAPDGLITVVLVWAAMKALKAVTAWFIDNTPVVNLEDKYVSYVNNADTNVVDYLSRKDTISPTYKVAYCTLATASFNIETNYDAYHQTLPGLYVTRVGMIVKSAHCSWGMHLKGKTTYNLPTIEGTPEVPVTTATGYVKLDYGDCCLFSRHAVLKFKVSGDLGYKKTSWDPKTK